MTQQTDRLTTGTSAGDASRHFGSQSWRTVVPTAFVLLIFAVPVLLPFANAAYVYPAQERIRRFADLLELSRAEAGHLTVRPQTTDLAALLRETVEEHRGTARAAGHSLELCIADDASPVVTDPERVRQVLGNLLTNAVKYTPDGGRIVVRAERRRCNDAADARRAGPWTAIEVDDTGPGIPADQLVAIFEEFSRLPAHADKPGAGLGLAIARRVARMLGGDLTPGSAPSGGARFTLWLPGAGQS